MTLTKKHFLAAVKLVKAKMAFQQQEAPRRNKMAAVGYRDDTVRCCELQARELEMLSE